MKLECNPPPISPTDVWSEFRIAPNNFWASFAYWSHILGVNTVDSGFHSDITGVELKY